MDSEEEVVAMDIIEAEEEIGVDDRGEAFPTTDRVFKEPEVVDEDNFHFEVITADEIVHHMVDCIKDVNTVVQIPATIMRILLNHLKWDKEKLMECYYGGNQEKLFSDAHIIPPCSRSRPVSNTCSSQCASPGLSSRQSNQCFPSDPLSAECKICFLPCSSAAMTGLECGHEFCSACWARYLTTKIMDEGMGQTIACAAHGCDISVDDILVDDESIMNLISDPKVKLKCQQLITNSFVECNRLLHGCPSPDCGHVVKVSHFEVKPVTCICGRTFCFACGENWHDPVQCKLLKRWIKKCDDDSETSNRIAANTRECPKCHATIEKDGGCNHMICKRCKFDFCWVCLGPWEPHGSSWYNCNRYDEEEAKKARDAPEKSRAALQRYLFYCNRYMNHMQSLKFEHKLYASISQKMEEMMQHMSWIEVRFLKRAVDVLCQCREVLMYTYIFAFYLKRNNQSLIFEDNQKDLENATEQLSEYLEREITSEILVGIKEKVQDKTRYCKSRRKVVLGHFHEGYDKDFWECEENSQAVIAPCSSHCSRRHRYLRQFLPSSISPLSAF